MSVQRYRNESHTDGTYPVPNKDGELVFYSDHQASLLSREQELRTMAEGWKNQRDKHGILRGSAQECASELLALLDKGGK